MTRLDDAFAQLADRGAPRGPDRVLGEARHRAAHLRRRRLVAMGGLATVVVLAGAATGLAVAGRDGGTRVESGLAATTDGAPPTSAPGPTPTLSEPVPSTSTPGTTEAEHSTTQPTDGPRTVQVFFLADTSIDCSTTRAVERQVRGPAVLRGALDELLEGPTEEEQAAGLTSWFSAATAGGVRSVEIVEGVALVDLRGELREAMPGASTSCGSAALSAQLDATVTQFDGVERALYSFDGDVAAFYGWLEGSAPDGSSSTPEADGIPAWPGTVEHEPGGTLGVGDIDAHLAQVDPGGRLGIEDIASLLLHLEDERARGTQVLVEWLPDGDGRRGLAVTLSGLADDSVAEVRYELSFEVGAGSRPTLTSGTWAQRCQPGRGHQDLRPELCV